MPAALHRFPVSEGAPLAYDQKGMLWVRLTGPLEELETVSPTMVTRLSDVGHPLVMRYPVLVELVGALMQPDQGVLGLHFADNIVDPRLLGKALEWLLQQANMPAAGPALGPDALRRLA